MPPRCAPSQPSSTSTNVPIHGDTVRRTSERIRIDDKTDDPNKLNKDEQQQQPPIQNNTITNSVRADRSSLTAESNSEHVLHSNPAVLQTAAEPGTYRPNDNTATTTFSATSPTPNVPLMPPNSMVSPYYGVGPPSLYGGGGGAPGMYGGSAGLLYGGSPSTAGMYGGYGMMGPYQQQFPFVSSLNQFLFNVQNLIVSLSQAVQIVGMNTEAVRQLLDSVALMWDHAIQSWQQMRTLELKQQSEEDADVKARRRRLRVLRWAIVAGTTYAGYTVIRRIVIALMRQGRTSRIEQERLSHPYLYSSPQQYYPNYSPATAGYGMGHPPMYHQPTTTPMSGHFDPNGTGYGFH